jgi:hypothetical protein
MLRRIEEHNASQPPPQKIRVSVEIEKPREELYQLFSYGEVVSAPHPKLTEFLEGPRGPLVLPVILLGRNEDTQRAWTRPRQPHASPLGPPPLSSSAKGGDQTVLGGSRSLPPLRWVAATRSEGRVGRRPAPSKSGQGWVYVEFRILLAA